MGIKDMIASEYSERVEELSKEVGEKEKKLEAIEKKYSEFANFKEGLSYAIEKNYKGLRALIHKKDYQVKIVDEKNNDLYIHWINVKDKTPKIEDVCGSFPKWARRIAE